MNKEKKSSGASVQTFAKLNQTTNQGAGAGAGLSSVGDALARAQVEASKFPAGVDWGAGRPLSRPVLAAAWYAGESDAMGLASVAVESWRRVVVVDDCGDIVRDEFGEPKINLRLSDDCQAADDMRLVKNCVRALVAKVKDKGATVTATMRDEARAAGLCALVQWRNGVSACPAVPGSRVVDAAAVVAWRAVSNELARDMLGHSVEASSVSDSWLVEGVEPWAAADDCDIVAALRRRDLAACQDDDRRERVGRWWRERGAARRKAQLPNKIDRLRHGHGRRLALVDRMEHAARLLLGGASIDDAAAAVGFKGRAHKSETSGAMLARAARAVGLKFRLTPPPKGAGEPDEFNPHKRKLSLGAGEPVKAFKPCERGAVLPLLSPVGAEQGAAIIRERGALVKSSGVAVKCPAMLSSAARRAGEHGLRALRYQVRHKTIKAARLNGCNVAECFPPLPVVGAARVVKHSRKARARMASAGE
jgi:hypothetical protein